MTAVFCHNAADRTARAWRERLEPFDRLEFADSDAAKGSARAVADTTAARRDDPDAPALEHGLDVFHTTTEARRVPAGHWRRAEATWEQAGTADAKVAAAKQRGLDARGVARTARAAWAKAVASFGQVERLESAWGRAHAAPDVVGPDGRPNDRGRAEAEVATAVAGLTGPDWAEVRNALAGRRCLAFPDRMHRRLGAAEPRPRRREAMAWRWWLLHHRPPTPDRLTGLVRAVGCGCVPGQDERGPYDRVAAVLKDTVRAGSAVECMNSVLRMQQSRHKWMTQPMLDLKRLYWNSRPFRSGPRQEACPYQALGLELPSPNFWELLQADARQLTQSLSIAHNAE